jgi:hypothetical protein
MLDACRVGRARSGAGYNKPDYKSYFSWPGFLVLHTLVIALFFRCTAKTQGRSRQDAAEE